MLTWKQAVYRGAIGGTLASVLSALALAACGRLESGTAAGPVNGPSQWLWGKQAARVRRASWRHTAVGYAIHHLMSVGWATVHEKQVASPIPVPFASHLGRGAVTAAVACFVDYQVAPRRLQPGFEQQLSRKSLLLVYAAFAVGLALGSAAQRR
jgi:hypothetical protein